MSQAKNLAKLAQNITSQGILSSAAVQGGGGGGGTSTSPTITAIVYTGNDTAVNTAGGDTVTLIGTNFNVGVSVVVNGTSASVVTRVSSTELNFVAPANATGSYIIYVVNTDGTTGLAVPGLQYSPVPVWTIAAGSLGTLFKNLSFSTTLTSTGETPITYSVYSGTLPSGISLNSSTGVLSGTTPDVLSSTTYNFTIRSTDAQLQDTDRAFSLTIIPTNPPPAVEYLVVAGGGGGGSLGGGGGAGGYRTDTGFAVSSGSPITVTVGAGGTGATGAPTIGTNGQQSVFSSITSTGGGAGGTWDSPPYTGNSGGSGGGATRGTTGASASPAGQGNAGGTATITNSTAGGGGAGVIGGNGTGSQAGAGGNGLSSSISGDATAYAGGGGGGGWSGVFSSGAGGTGGGGDGGGVGTPGTTNTGGGGGGGGFSGSGFFAGGAGGSGIVIIRYADTYAAATSTTGSPTITVAGGYRVYKWTSSGSITF